MCALYNALAAMMSGETMASQHPAPGEALRRCGGLGDGHVEGGWTDERDWKVRKIVGMCREDFAEQRKQRIRILPV